MVSFILGSSLARTTLRTVTTLPFGQLKCLTAAVCSLLARFFKILLNKARTEDELENVKRGGGGSRSVGNGAASGTAATRPAAPPAAARFDTTKSK